MLSNARCKKSEAKTQKHQSITSVNQYISSAAFQVLMYTICLFILSLLIQFIHDHLLGLLTSSIFPYRILTVVYGN